MQPPPPFATGSIDMQAHIPRHLPRHATQRGAALLVALILLIVITLVGLAAIGTTLLQNKMSANQYDRQIAFQSAEAALRVAAATLQGNPSLNIRDCSQSGSGAPVCTGNPFNDACAVNASLTGCMSAADIYAVPKTDTSGSGTGFDPGSIASGQPQYVIEYMGTQTQAYGAQSANCQQANSKLTCGSTNFKMYRVTARSGDPATSGSRAVVTLQVVMKMS